MNTDESSLYKLRIETAVAVAAALSVPRPEESQFADFCLKTADKVVNEVRSGFPKFNHKEYHSE